MMPVSLQLAEHVSADGILKDIAMVSHVTAYILSFDCNIVM